MEFSKIDLSVNSKLKCQFELSIDNSILITKFSGNYSVGSEGNIDGNYIFSNLVSKYFIYEPIVVILDFSELEYTWGNTILRTLNFYNEIGRDEDEIRKFIGFIVNESNKKPIIDLLNTLSVKPHYSLFNNRIEAIEKAEKEVQEFLR